MSDQDLPVLPADARRTNGNNTYECRKWHPDRNADNTEKAEQKFREVGMGLVGTEFEPCLSAQTYICKVMVHVADCSSL